jgi:hypothetical protein
MGEPATRTFRPFRSLAATTVTSRRSSESASHSDEDVIATARYHIAERQPKRGPRLSAAPSARSSWRPSRRGCRPRIEVFNRAAYELTITARTKWISGSEKSPRWWFTWIAWLAGKEGPPVNRRIARADLAPLPHLAAQGAPPSA